MPKRIEEGDTKICKKCKKEKIIEKFGFNNYIRKDGTKGRRSQCKLCDIENLHNFAKENPEKKKESQCRWYRENIERVAAKNLRWAEKNRFKRALTSSRHDSIRHGYVPCLATVEEIEAAFTGFCHNPGCQIPEIECKRRLCLHHDHKTGAFLNWYCRRCNFIMGLADDNSEILRGLIMQLEQPQVAK